MAGIKPKDLTQNYTGADAVTWVHGDNATTSVSERVSIQNIIDATGVASKIDSAEKGANSGLATLDASGLVPTSQLPSYVDDVLEFADEASFPVTGETAKIYVALDVNLTYRWSGSAYVEISKSLALGETETTAYRGDRGKVAYDHSQVAHDKALVGLGNVDNTADADKPLTEEAKLLAATMTKVDFFALAKQRRDTAKGSGELSVGTIGVTEAVNSGLNGSVVIANQITLGSGTEFLVNGVVHKVGGNISLAPAPDGTKTYDSATGVVTEHATSVIAFTAETATNKVITSRKDLVFLETWHEAIEEKDAVYYLGNVQFGGSNPYSSPDIVRNWDGYAYFGEWDTNTYGIYSRWSDMPDDQKKSWLADPENNIYFDPVTSQYIQVRYRIRVVEGKGDNWTNISTQVENFLRYDSENNVVIRGSGSGTFIDFAGGSTSSYHGNHPNTSTWSDGMFTCSDSYSLISITPRAVPICLVQR